MAVDIIFTGPSNTGVRWAQWFTRRTGCGRQTSGWTTRRKRRASTAFRRWVKGHNLHECPSGQCPQLLIAPKKRFHPWSMQCAPSGKAVLSRVLTVSGPPKSRRSLVCQNQAICTGAGSFLMAYGNAAIFGAAKQVIKERLAAREVSCLRPMCAVAPRTWHLQRGCRLPEVLTCGSHGRLR